MSRRLNTDRKHEQPAQDDAAHSKEPAPVDDLRAHAPQFSGASLLTFSEAALLTNMSERALLALLTSGRGPRVTLGPGANPQQRMQFTRADLARWMLAQ